MPFTPVFGQRLNGCILPVLASIFIRYNWQGALSSETRRRNVYSDDCDTCKTVATVLQCYDLRFLCLAYLQQGDLKFIGTLSCQGLSGRVRTFADIMAG
ncbi:hypothetical protein PoB_001804500 [Plakobranchus ocellatus]|uniref:Reverse transcriptase domain-containing protein n=1 Tax=Plakobranchus ocellatus TaxID=259542 RepID=A0AAV3ZAH1_9GAST|nr:hypothetical protein PoB_001804500 [Plakobranchus ocellatus]